VRSVVAEGVGVCARVGRESIGALVRPVPLRGHMKAARSFRFSKLIDKST